ncbi:MAG: hypothetical protein ACI9JR_002210, partial [Gammaproteobacteria bacterium]
SSEPANCDPAAGMLISKNKKHVIVTSDKQIVAININLRYCFDSLDLLYNCY